MGRSTEAREYAVKRSWLFVASALVALFATTAFAYGAEAPLPPFDTNAECLQCHSVGASGSAVSKVDFSVVGGVDLNKCAACHRGNYLEYSHPHFTGACENCHNNDDAFYFPWPGNRQYPVNTPYGHFLGLNSLTATPAKLHAVHSQNSSWVNQAFGSGYPACASCHAPAACSACHEAPIAHGDHATPTYPGRTIQQANGVTAPVEASTCIDPACHSLATAGSAAFTPSCGSCHPTNTNEHGYEAPMHTADVTTTVGAGGKLCGDCHEMELSAEHQRTSSASKAAGCGACHPVARGTFSAWNQTCAQGGCHAAGSPTAAHGDIAAGHAPLTTGEAAICTSCHTGGDLGAIHATAVSGTDPSKTSCLVCHSSSSVPSTKDCTTCHFANADHPYPAQSHQSSWTLANCGGAGCHSTRDLLGVHVEKNAAFGCVECHGSTNPKVVASLAAGLTGCGDCHEGVTQDSGHDGQHWASPLLMDGSGPHYGYDTGSSSTAPTSDCAGCHTSNLIAEHIGAVDPATGNSIRSPRYDSQGNALGCASCHSALPGSLVANAIATGQTKCDACHVTHKQIPTTHTSTFVSDPAVPCAPCHSAQVEYSHNGTYTVTTASGKVLSGCEVCHGYYEGARGAQVQAAISATNDTKCTACHAATHPDKGGHSATSSESLGCGSCHADGQTVVDIRSLHPSCVTCHENPSRVPNIADKTAECASCHSSVGVDYHSGLPGKHVDGTMASSCQSASCHVNSLPEAHASYIAGQSTYATTCALCHANGDPNRIPADATAACNSCHASIHPNMDHSADNSQACVSCHETGDVMTLHTTGGQTDCALCHGAAARVTPLPATVDCVNCHADISPADPKHYISSKHATLDGFEGGYACSACHGLDLKTEHAKASISPAVTCVSCHETKVDGLVAPWNKTCATCHATKHSAMAAKHTSTKTACAGTGCHLITDVAALHSATTAKCGTCHGAGKTPSTDCATTGCHSTVTGNHEAQHDTVGVTDIGCQGCHFQLLTTEHSKLGYSCATCHSSTNTAVVAAITGGNRACDACHPAVNGKDYHKPQNELEFVPGNSAMHRVTSDLPGMRSSFKVSNTAYTWTLPTVSSFLKAGWTTDSVVTCDKCHTYTGSTGPHGATMKVNIDPAYPGDYQTAYLGDSGSSPNTVICAKCHTNFNGMNEVHNTGDHHGSSDGKCVNCHAGVPHGWRLPRMLAYTTDPAPYRTIANGLAAISLSNRSPSNWTESNCQAACGGGDHSSRPSSVWPSTVVTVGNLSGTITGTGGTPLAGVSVTTDKGQSGTTDAAGKYTFTGVTTGAYVVTAAKTGYATQSKSTSVANGLTATVNFAMTAQATATNLARTGTGSASSVYSSSYDASKAFDGSTTTYWRSSSGGTQWLRTDLGAAKSVSKVVVKWYDTTYYARGYRIETSTDGTSWTSRYSTTSASSGTKTHTFSAVSARYVRIYCTSANSSNYRIGEFEVWNF